MTERKFTDEEVIRAFECCIADVIQCWQCPLRRVQDCRYELSRYVLDLINRQRAEIEKWQLAYDCADSALRELSVTRSEAIKEFAERLRHTLVINNEENDVYFDYAYTLETIDNLVKEMTEGKPCTEGADCSTCENCYHDGGYNECATDGVKL